MTTPSTPGKTSLPLLISAFLSVSGIAMGQIIPAVHPEIASAWKATAGDALLIFRHDGIYYHVEDSVTESGMERGFFFWDKTYSTFFAATIVDTNGEAGLSHPAEATTLTISGNTLTYTVAGQGSFTFSRVVNTASAIVGSWFIPGDQTTVTFLADGTYYNTEEANDAPFGYDGMERGTYTWDPNTHVLTASATTDTNGDVGLSSLPPGFTATISGNSMTVSDGGETTTLRRITQIPAPLNTENDFEVDQFSNYRQTSTATPALLPVPVTDDYPFWGEAYINESVPGTGGTLTIASQAPRSFGDDGGWSIEEEYTSLVNLNASSAFPNGANYVFARSGGSATLSYPSDGAFPPAPKIQGEDGTWSGGEYFLHQNQTLTWGAHANYDPATHLTALSVVDRETSEVIMYEVVIQGDITSYDFSYMLTPGSSYDVLLEHVKVASATTAGAGPFAGKLGYALYNSNTRFVMVAPNEASSLPTISEHPVSQVPAENSSVTLTVSTQDEDPTQTFQWFKNNDAIPGQTGNSLSFLNYSSADNAGTYKVEITNAQGTVTSNPAVLGESEIFYVYVGKSIEFQQTGPSTVIVNPHPVEALYGGPYGFDVSVIGLNLASIPAPVITPPPGTPNTVNDPFYESLFYNGEDDEWNYGPNANNWGATSQLQIDSKFPNGTYTFEVNGGSIPLELTGDAYPNTPQVTLTGGSWVNGKYAIASSATLTVTTNVFQQYTANDDGFIALWVDGQGLFTLASENPGTDFLTYSLPAAELQTYEPAEIEVDFEAVVDQKRNVLGIDYAEALYRKELEVEVHVLPEITFQSSSEVVSLGESLDLQVSASGTPAADSGNLNYQWKKDGSDIPGLSSPSFGLIGFGPDDAGTYTCTVSNDVGSVTSQPIHLEFADAFQAYVASFGLNSVTTGAPDLDHDNDGIVNLMEFIFGGNPVVPNPSLLPSLTTTPAVSGQNLVFTYRRKLAASSINQTIEHTADLSAAWTPAIHGQNGVTIATTPVDAETEQVTVTIPATGTKRFVRLKASR